MINCANVAATKKYMVAKIETMAARLPRVAAGEVIELPVERNDDLDRAGRIGKLSRESLEA
jgi:hypothetical protein